MPSLNVHLLHSPNAPDLALLQSLLLSDIHLTLGLEIPSPAEYDILVAGRPERTVLQASTRLRVLVIPFAGLPAITRQLLEDFPGVAVHNLHHNAALTAEMALALMLAAAKLIIPADQALRQNDWSVRYQPSQTISLSGKTALILGFGQVGQRIGRACAGLGMRILAIRRDPSRNAPLDYPVEIYPLPALTGLLPNATVLHIALPDTPETEGLLGAGELALLPPGAILVNVGRAAIVNQAALYQALQTGRLGGAGLDVWYHYPNSQAEWRDTPPADYPFHELENVVLSPHRAGHSAETETLRMVALAELLNAAANGHSIPNRVNLSAGY